MQRRAQSVVVKVCLALAGALGAGFSGDMQSRTVGHGGHHARHTRGPQHRNARTNGRETHGDHAQEIELRQRATLSTRIAAVDTACNDTVAILPTLSFPPTRFYQVARVLAPIVGFARPAQRLHLPARAPPALA